MADRKVGIYSMYHDITVHTYGLADARTVRLAHMFTHLLDSDKTGLRPKEEVVKADRRQFGAAVPDCMKKDVDPDMEQFGQKIRLRRRKELGSCILCQLMDAGKEEKEQLLIKYNQHKDKLSERDEDVIGPWDDANRRAASNAPGAEVLKSDMAIVRAHVDRALEAWRKVSWNDFAKSPTKSLGKRSKGGGTTKKSRQETVDEIAAQFHEAPAGISIVTSANEVRRWKVGYAMKQNPKFAFAVAFWDVCGIKAETKGRSTATAAIASLSNIPPSVLKVLQPAEDP
ncbi:hypothetical protein GLOTRDRAFT_130742 [Gloeophyllum trabeum ATCC 11539]|uniref:Uncharacterized protein n=1 Tax=Gloeophyllum trabeum (strain ATCC 11539 / FP-39264 / Madison 617) TaxID=670483 RepID=S7Q0W0_GLOTA|nr:uncharacterized protein GLOTRDRAFT_130742 [Gloeophyllum trabeum ATCC 11539]EPQ53403.1 hypothetical protein GLOTRDRAFT_130742 [Gloeophyllum trabeum ATCC 11539]